MFITSISHIPQDEGTAVCLDALQDHDLLPMSRELLQTLFDIVLKCDVFSFSTHTFQQTQGTVMWTKMATSYVKLFMGNLEEKFLEKEPHRTDFWKRFIDNILCVRMVQGSLLRLSCTDPSILSNTESTLLWMDDKASSLCLKTGGTHRSRHSKSILHSIIQIYSY